MKPKKLLPMKALLPVTVMVDANANIADVVRGFLAIGLRLDIQVKKMRKVKRGSKNGRNNKRAKNSSLRTCQIPDLKALAKARKLSAS